MRYLRLIPHSLYPSSHFQSSIHSRSKIVLFSTQSITSSSSNLYRKPELGIPTNPLWSRTRYARESTSVGEEKKLNLNPSQNILGIVDEICALNSIETMAVFEIVSKKLGLPESDIPILFPMMPGMTLGGGKGSGKGGGAKAEAAKVEKTAFDLKLEKFDAAAKIKIIKEVRTFTDLGLKEAKELVEKAPTLLKKGVTKEEAEKIIAKMKEIGAQVSME